MAHAFDYDSSSFPDEGQPLNPPPTFSLDFWSDCEEPTFEAFVAEVRCLMQSARPVKRWSEGRTPVLRLMLCNLIENHFRRPGRGTRFYLKPEMYSGATRYRPRWLSGKVLRGVIEALEASGLIFVIKGRWNVIRELGTMSQAAPTPELVALWTGYGITAEMIRPSQARPLMVLRSTKRRISGRSGRSFDLVEPPPADTNAGAYLDRAARRLAKINRHLRSFTLWAPDYARKIDQPLGDLWMVDDGRWIPAQGSDAAWLIGLNRTDLTRIFNDEAPDEYRFDRGGRFYGGWWQSIRSEDRSRITIDGEPTIELDYANLHPRMIYHQAGLDVAGDLYDLPALAQLSENHDPAKLRDAVKALWQVLINSNARQLSTLGRLDREELCDRWKIELPGDLHPVEVINLIRAKHGAVADALGVASGLSLQAVDAQICEAILTEGRVRRMPILPIHDSFVVRVSDEEALRSLMTKHYRRKLGFDPVIKLVAPDNWDSPILAWSQPDELPLARSLYEEGVDFSTSDLSLNWEEAE